MADRIIDPATGVSIREMAGRSGVDAIGADAISRLFLCKGSSDPMDCLDALYNQEEALGLMIFANLSLNSISWQLKAGHEAWTFTASYSQKPEPGAYTITMDSMGGTVVQTESYQQATFPAPGKQGRYAGKYSVNVQDNKVLGVDRVIPSLKLNINARIATSWVTDPITYAKNVASLTGSVNSEPYLGFAAGELLFLGATGEIVGENPLLNYSFAASSNLTGLEIGPVGGITKAGHDFLWIEYEKIVDAATLLEVEVAAAAYVAEMYQYNDFTPLRIGEAG